MSAGRPHVGKRSLSGKIFSSVLAFTLCVIAAVAAILTGMFYVSYSGDCEARLMAQAHEAAQQLEEGPGSRKAAALGAQFAGIVRFTLVDGEGAVLYDSATADPTTLGNHNDRPEVAEARETGEAAATRLSGTLGTVNVYAAVLLDDGSVVRLSETRELLFGFMEGLVLPLIALLAAVAAAVLLLSRALTRRIMKPIDALDFARPLENDIYEEMTPLLSRIDEQQRQLKEQNEELARAESMRRDFSANVSHEMKTPLQVIAGYAELMRDGAVPPDDASRVAGLIYDESQAMRSLIDDVLTLSRLDEAALDGDVPAPVDVRAVAVRVAGRLAALAEERRVHVEVAPGELTVWGSETLVEEMLYNLVANGIRYNHEGGRVDVALSEEPGENGRTQAVIRVSDTGPGIPPDKHEKIFERFYRMEKSRSKETGGTGLGLAIVKHAALYHDGVIEVQSEPGRGAAFILRFPGK